MSKFLIRIELHHETNYNLLHAALARRGISRIITGDNGVAYRLPTGTYYCVSPLPIAGVHASAKSAAIEAGHAHPALVVSEASVSAWSGLDVVSAHEQRLGI